MNSNNENNIFNIEVESIIENNIFYLFEFYHIGYIYIRYTSIKKDATCSCTQPQKPKK